MNYGHGRRSLGFFSTFGNHADSLQKLEISWKERFRFINKIYEPSCGIACRLHPVHLLLLHLLGCELWPQGQVESASQFSWPVELWASFWGCLFPQLSTATCLFSWACVNTMLYTTCRGRWWRNEALLHTSSSSESLLQFAIQFLLPLFWVSAALPLTYVSLSRSLQPPWRKLSLQLIVEKSFSRLIEVAEWNSRKKSMLYTPAALLLFRRWPIWPSLGGEDESPPTAESILVSGVAVSDMIAIACLMVVCFLEWSSMVLKELWWGIYVLFVRHENDMISQRGLFLRVCFWTSKKFWWRDIQDTLNCKVEEWWWVEGEEEGEEGG